MLLYASVVSYLICMFVMYVLYVCCCCWCSSYCCTFCSCRCWCYNSLFWSLSDDLAADDVLAAVVSFALVVADAVCLGPSCFHMFIHWSAYYTYRRCILLYLSYVLCFLNFLCPIKFYANYLHYKIWLVLQTILLIQVMSTLFCYCFVNHQYSHMLFIIVTSNYPLVYLWPI